MSIEAVARALSGERNPRIESSQINKGLANLGCFLHEVTTEKGQKIQFIEKRTNRIREVDFARRAAPFYSSTIGPHIYEVLNGSAYQAIFMEFVEGVAFSFELNDENARRLGESIAAIWQPTLSAGSASLLHSQAMQIERLPDCVQEDGLGIRETLVTIEAIVGLAKELYERARTSLPLVPAHNDIHLKNIAYSASTRTEYRIRLIDWGQFSANFVGADLHHFFVAARSRPVLKPFTMQAVRTYREALNSRGLPVSEDDIRLGAGCYELIRLIARYISRRGEGHLKRLLDCYEQSNATRMQQ